MITDERLDQLIRASMEWRSTEDLRTQPTLRQATGRLAARIGRSGTAVRPRLTLSPATGGSMHLVLLLALLLLLGVAIYVGAQLLRQPSFVPPPGPFGFAAECSIPVDLGVAFDEPTNETVLRFTAPDGPDADQEDDYLAVYADGRLVQDISQSPETRVDEITGSQLSVRRLSPAGVELVLARVADAGLSPGCRVLQTQESTGTLTARTQSGATEASWSPTGTATSYAITPEAERTLLDLNEDLSQPESWLPADAWLDESANLAQPHHWLITLTLRPSEHEAGEEVQLPNGNTLTGSDPRIRSVELPGGADPLTYGAPLELADPVGPGSSVRCAEGSIQDATALASSLEELTNGVGLGTDGEGELFTEDLTWSISFGIQPVFGASYDCTDLAATWQLAATPTATASPAPPTGDLADVDPCTFVTVDAAAQLGANQVERRPSRLPLGIPAHSCVVVDSAVAVDLPVGVVDPLPPGYRAIVSLYPRTVSGGLAQEVVDAVFGPGLVPQEGGMQRLWVRRCDDEMMPCSDAIIGWTRSYLVFFEFTNDATPIESVSPSGEWAMTWQLQVSPEQASEFVATILENVAQD